MTSSFPVTVHFASQTRSLWQQLVTSSSPTLVVDGCFYFTGFVNVPKTSLADPQVNCPKEQGTMLPSVGSVHCSQRATTKSIQHSCDDSQQVITCQLRSAALNSRCTVFKRLGLTPVCDVKWIKDAWCVCDSMLGPSGLPIRWPDSLVRHFHGGRHCLRGIKEPPYEGNEIYLGCLFLRAHFKLVYVPLQPS